MISDDSKCLRNPIQSNPNTESNPNPNISTEPQNCASMPLPVISLPLNDGEMFPIFDESVTKWEALYPAVDVRQELREMLGWLDSHPQKRKTKRGINAFITGWLGREQDHGGRKSAPAQDKSFSWAELAKQMDEQEGIT
jgi:hypothetical protein